MCTNMYSSVSGYVHFVNAGTYNIIYVMIHKDMYGQTCMYLYTGTAFTYIGM